MPAEILFERSWNAAKTVDPLILANALEHIYKTALQSKSQTRRIRWIAVRADTALKGKDYEEAKVDLPRKPPPRSVERLQKRLAYHCLVKHQLAEALEGLRSKEEVLATYKQSCGDLLAEDKNNYTQQIVDDEHGFKHRIVSADGRTGPWAGYQQWSFLDDFVSVTPYYSPVAILSSSEFLSL